MAEGLSPVAAWLRAGPSRAGFASWGEGLSISGTEISVVLSHIRQGGSMPVFYEEIKPKILLLGLKATGSSKGPIFES